MPNQDSNFRLAMRRLYVILALTGLGSLIFLGCSSPSTTSSDQVTTVRMSDVGWSDITVTTAAVRVVLEAIGYQVDVEMLSVPVTYASLKNGDIDIFMGTWLPAQAQDLAPYLKDGSVEKVRVNLTGAKYTMAVPEYVALGGLTSFSDIDKFRDKLDGEIYGIEPGNDGNRLVLDMISEDKFGLGDFELVESSEQGMLAQVKRAVDRNEWIVFLGWAPHPMNARYDMTYLSGGEDVFGPDFGGATVTTVARAGFLDGCGNCRQLFDNIAFTLEMENTLMTAMLEDKIEPKAAALDWFRTHPEVLDQWLEGVVTLDGGDALPHVKRALGVTQ